MQAYIEFVLGLVRIEWGLLHERRDHPECQPKKVGKVPRVDIRWKKEQYKMKIVELVVGLVLVGELCNSQGVVLSETALVAMIEEVFGVCLKNFSQLKDQLFRRQNGYTPFLKQMIRAVELCADEKYNLPLKRK